ncbi:MAG: DUF2442 domain-containing protein [Deltaproteobacteria bacterium HGW-Deltaproteobacteria-22]|jgi:hypothetical protein|nr:MAG: DUF2442 domain-containing protein [Deltaproteobacteria bacterium HGW-Deltaproteobacteria-22]
MTSLAIEIDVLSILDVVVTEDSLTVKLNDGRTLTTPLAWFPRLQNATDPERLDFRLTGAGHGIHWPRLDEDVSLAGLIAGRPSSESPASLQAWLRTRTP